MPEIGVEAIDLTPHTLLETRAKEALLIEVNAPVCPTCGTGLKIYIPRSNLASGEWHCEKCKKSYRMNIATAQHYIDAGVVG